MSTRCFSSCRKNKTCKLPLCRMINGKKWSYCRLSKEYKLNEKCEEIPKEKTIPVKHKSIPVKHKSIPVKEKTISVKHKSIPVKEKTISVKHKSIPVKHKSLSYRPTINKELVSFPLKKLGNIELCGKMDGSYYRDLKPVYLNINGKCTYILDSESKKLLLSQLSSSRKLNMKTLVTPKQSSANCWFNCLFVCMFISDKGRHFFHFFRQLMINGKLSNGDTIPLSLRNGFALLNYNVQSCLTGNKYAVTEMDTNVIIKEIYEKILETKGKDFIDDNNISDVDMKGNSFYYYKGIVNYLSIQSINMLFGTPYKLEDTILKSKKKHFFAPHVIVIDYIHMNHVTNKRLHFKMVKDNYEYKLDSVCIINNNRHHFICLVTCNGDEYIYDGMSYSTLIPFKWKSMINKDEDFKVGKLDYNFLIGYSLFIYYRTK